MTIQEMRERKKELGYTYEQIAEYSGVPVGTVQKVLGGVTVSPRYATLQALEKALLDRTGESRSPSFSGEDSDRSGVPGYFGKKEGQRMPEPYGVREETSHITMKSFTPGEAEKRRMAEYDRLWAGHSDRVCEPETIFAAKHPGEYTLEDYYRLPDKKRMELIDGYFYDMAAPRSLHQLLTGILFARLLAFVTAQGGSCLPIVSPVDVQLDRDDRTMVQPDILVVCDRNKVLRRCVYGAPDFVIEILSPSTRRKDSVKKLQKYADAGVREYWLVDPERRAVIVYNFEAEIFPVLYGFDAKIPVGIWDGLCEIDFAEIYEYVRFLYEKEDDGEDRNE